jgi:hypothetical protein
MDAQQKGYVENAVLQTLDECFQAACRCDASGFMPFLVDTDEMTVIENGELRSSRWVSEEWIKEFFAGLVKLEASAEERRVFPLSPDVAVATGVRRCSAQTISADTVAGATPLLVSLSRRKSVGRSEMFTNPRFLLRQAHRAQP